MPKCVFPGYIPPIPLQASQICCINVLHYDWRIRLWLVQGNEDLQQQLEAALQQSEELQQQLTQQQQQASEQLQNVEQVFCCFLALLRCQTSMSHVSKSYRSSTVW